MNAFNRANLEYILRDPACWELVKDGGQIVEIKPKMHNIRDQAQIAKEVRFYDEVYFPHLARFMERVHRTNLFPCTEWEQKELGYARPIMVWIAYDTELQDYISDRLQYYLEPLWYSEEWGHEHLSAEDVLSMGIRPDNIQAVQAKMF